MYNKIEKTATIVSHAHGLKFTVINQTREQLLQIRAVLQRQGAGVVLILLPNNCTL